MNISGTVSIAERHRHCTNRIGGGRFIQDATLQHGM